MAIKKYPEYNYEFRPNNIVSQAVKEFRTGKCLKNKYLYLESTGEKNWVEVEKALGLCQNEEALIKKYFEEIDRIIKEHCSLGKYDIISLGCGTGTDDISILQKNNQMENFSVTTIDLSWCILEHGTKNIYNYLLTHVTDMKKVPVLGVCCDFETMGDHIKTILEGRRFSKNKSLFHLLGLTIGNNKEKEILKNISKLMHDGDFLLLSVDLSAGDSEAIEKSIESYNSGDAIIPVNNFLLGPLNFATHFLFNKAPEPFKDKSAEMKQDSKKHELKLNTVISLNGEKVDYYTNDFFPKLIKTESLEKDWEKYSDIKNTIALTRYYQFGGDEKYRILCDYSNKYDQTQFDTFIQMIASDPEILLAPVSGVDKFSFGAKATKEGEHGPNQYLILLNKISISSHKRTSKKTPNISSLYSAAKEIHNE